MALSTTMDLLESLRVITEVRGSSLEKSVYPQAIDFQKNHTELKDYAEAWTSVRSKHNSEDLPRTFCYVKALIQK